MNIGIPLLIIALILLYVSRRTFVKSYSQCGQDMAIMRILGTEKRYFIEIGSNDAIHDNNTYLMESNYGWRGIMVEYDKKYEDGYKKHRKSEYIISDARAVNYREMLDSMNFPQKMGYLQIDLDVDNRSTLDVLEKLNNTVFDKYTFAFVTFEHDIYTGDHYNTREISRQVFEKRGYIRIASDVLRNDKDPFEDWYVHPSMVDTSKINISSNIPWKILVSGITTTD